MMQLFGEDQRKTVGITIISHFLLLSANSMSCNAKYSRNDEHTDVIINACMIMNITSYTRRLAYIAVACMWNEQMKT